MKSNQRKKNDGLLAIIFCLILLAYAGTGFNQTGNMQLLFAELASLFLLIYSILEYIKISKADKKKKVKKKKYKPITKMNNKFKKNFLKINKKYKPKAEARDLKTEYIQSAWDEINKL